MLLLRVRSLVAETRGRLPSGMPLPIDLHAKVAIAQIRLGRRAQVC